MIIKTIKFKNNNDYMVRIQIRDKIKEITLSEIYINEKDENNFSVTELIYGFTADSLSIDCDLIEGQEILPYRDKFSKNKVTFKIEGMLQE